MLQREKELFATRRKGAFRDKKKRSFSRQREKELLLHREKALFAIKREASEGKEKKRSF